MLNKLFGSNSRVKILKLFLTNPNDKYYIRQIARDLKLQLNSVRRELENLEKFGLLISNPAEEGEGEEAPSREDFIRQGRNKDKKDLPAKLDKKYYQANRSFILYEEVRNLILKAQMLYERDFVDRLQRIGKPRLLILTGFFVNDDAKGVDLLVVGKLNRNKFLRVIADLERDLGREINYTHLTTNEFKYRRDITDVFLYDILDGRKLVVIDEYNLS